MTVDIQMSKSDLSKLENLILLGVSLLKGKRLTDVGLDDTDTQYNRALAFRGVLSKWLNDFSTYDGTDVSPVWT